MEKRVINCQRELSKTECDGILVTNLTNIYYLTGFSGTNAMVFISDKHRIFMTDSRYVLIAKETIKGFDIIETREPLKTLSEVLQGSTLKILGFDDQVTFSFYRELKSFFQTVELRALNNFLETIRMVKDEGEISCIRQACAISDKAFIDVLDFIRPGQTSEREVADFLDFRMRHYGATGVSFETIVASGHRSAMPHGVATDKIIQNGESLTMDFGCYYKHYVSDMTRTIHIGHVTDQEREIYAVTLSANQTLINQTKAGMTRREYDRVARDVITKAGYGQQFTHGIGHGIGLDIHEIPYFGASDEPIVSGMVVTDEPGIYIDNCYGVRIEDDLLVTDTGCEVLTLAPKELIVL